MDSTLSPLFLEFSVRKLRLLSGRIETCLGRLSAEQIWTRATENENAIGNLVLHLCGNVRQWIVAGVGEQPDIRQRDTEFAARAGGGAGELLGRLRTAVDEAIAVIESLTPERLTERRTIQKYEGTVLEAVYHVVEHFSMHTGQIIFATKLLTGEDLGFYGHLRTTAAHGHKTP
jgi:uncharacterized damage-inducible protein DinB